MGLTHELEKVTELNIIKNFKTTSDKDNVDSKEF